MSGPEIFPVYSLSKTQALMIEKVVKAVEVGRLYKWSNSAGCGGERRQAGPVSRVEKGQIKPTPAELHRRNSKHPISRIIWESLHEA